MFKVNATGRATIRKVWSRFSIIQNDGKKMKFTIEELPKDRFEEFMDFNMNYFVKHEITHTISGIPESEDAMKEYRQILSNKLKKPSNHIFICTKDVDEKGDGGILAFSVTRMLTKENFQDQAVKAQTKEVKKFFKILREWDDLYPVSDILKKYGIDRFNEDGGLAVHPDYRRLGLAKPFFPLRRLVSKTSGIPITSAWITSRGSQRAAEIDGWETAYEISYEKLGRILGLTFKNVPPTCKYMIGKV